MIESRLFKLGATDIVVLLGFILLCSVELSSFGQDPGLGWHLKTGEWILSHLAIPRFDPFLASAEPRAWVCDQWLSDVLMYSMWKLGSWPLLYACGISLIVFTFVLLPLSFFRNSETSFIATVFATFIGLKLASVHFVLRPVLLSFLLFGIVLSILVHLSRKQVIGKAVWVGLPLFFALWANLHPSFVIGLGLLLLLSIARTCDLFFFGLRTQSETFTTRLLVLFLLCAAATLINPYGLSLHQSILDLGSSSYFMSLHSEWQGLNLRNPEGELFLLAIFIFSFCSFISRGKSNSHWRFFEFFMLLCFSFLALRTVRFLPYFGLVAAWLLAESISPFFSLPHTKFIKSLDSRLRIGSGLVSFLVMNAGLLAVAKFQGVIPLYSGEFGPSTSKYPYSAVEKLRSLHEGSQPLRIFSISNWGGFITWYGEGKLVPHIDDRNTLVGEKFMREYLDHLEIGADYRGYARRMGAYYLLLPKSLGLSKFIESYDSGGMIYSDEQAIVVRIDA